jgi:transposase-like protein
VEGNLGEELSKLGGDERGTFQKDQPMIVMCLHQRKGSVTEFYVPQQKRQSILGTLQNHVKQGAMIYPDDYRPYKFLHRHGYKHKFVRYSEREYARGNVHINNCECRTNLYKQALDEEGYGSE